MDHNKKKPIDNQNKLDNLPQQRETRNEVFYHDNEKRFCANTLILLQAIMGKVFLVNASQQQDWRERQMLI
jgi:hypothetical protein